MTAWFRSRPNGPALYWIEIRDYISCLAIAIKDQSSRDKIDIDIMHACIIVEQPRIEADINNSKQTLEVACLQEKLDQARQSMYLVATGSCQSENDALVSPRNRWG